mmetsp:Transcript_18127/g.68507  ORF Transcript_18127/g.68507 Transcript_18127/m.68507 type:complete len:238 (-) Transcript_18127:684-1397(-)
MPAGRRWWPLPPRGGLPQWRGAWREGWVGRRRALPPKSRLARPRGCREGRRSRRAARRGRELTGERVRRGGELCHPRQRNRSPGRTAKLPRLPQRRWQRNRTRDPPRRLRHRPRQRRRPRLRRRPRRRRLQLQAGWQPQGRPPSPRHQPRASRRRQPLPRRPPRRPLPAPCLRRQCSQPEPRDASAHCHYRCRCCCGFGRCCRCVGPPTTPPTPRPCAPRWRACRRPFACPRLLLGG